MTLSEWQVKQIAELMRPGESVQVSIVDGVAMAEVFSERGELAMLELIPRWSTSGYTRHLFCTDFGVERGPRESA